MVPRQCIAAIIHVKLRQFGEEFSLHELAPHDREHDQVTNQFCNRIGGEEQTCGPVVFLQNFRSFRPAFLFIGIQKFSGAPRSTRPNFKPDSLRPGYRSRSLTAGRTVDMGSVAGDKNSPEPISIN